MNRMMHALLSAASMGGVVAVLVLLTALPAHAQDAPRNLQARVSDRSVDLTWAAPALDSQDRIEEYVIYRDTSPIPGNDPDETEADEIGRVREPENDPATAFTDTEVDRGITYYYRVTAETREVDEGGAEESDFSNPANVTLPPAVTLTNPSVPSPAPHPEDAPLTISATLSSTIGIKSATLHVRPGGAPAFTERMQALSGDEVTYEESIASDTLTPRGLDLFLTVIDTDEQTTRVPEAGYISLPVATDGLSTPHPGGTSQTAFRMVGFPLALDNPQLSEILEDDLGPPQIEQWRLFSIGPNGLTGEDGGYVEIQNFSSTAQPGSAYWLITRDDATLTTGPGTSLPTNEPFTIALQEGWNLISNPFAFDFPLSAIQVENSSAALNDVQAYEGTFVPLNPGTDALAPMEGYLVRLSNGAPGTLRLDPDLTASDAAASNSKQRAASLDWAIHIAAQVQQARDVHNTVAVSPDAARSYDALDRFEPPPIGKYVSVAFPHTDWGPYRGAYRRDVRPPAASLQDWTFTVRSNIQDVVALSFRGLETVPPEFAVWLVNERLGVRQNLRDTPHYRFNALPASDSAPFRLLVGPPEAVRHALNETAFLPERVTLFPNYPNPFTPTTTIRYALPAPMPVTLRVYDILGREVATLRSTERDAAGTHTVVWDGRTRSGRPAASGTYLYRLQAGNTVRSGHMVLVR